jgi:phosphatidate cytidylyltransferase
VLRERLISAAILIAVLTVCLWLDMAYPIRGVSGVWLMLPLGFFTFGTAGEFVSLLQKSGTLVRAPVAIGGAMIVAISAGVPLLWPLFGGEYPADCPVGRLGWIGLSTILCAATALMIEMQAYGRAAGGGIQRVAAAVLVATYVGIPMALIGSIRNLGADPNWGFAAIVTFIAVTKASDTGAFFTGKAIGRHKLIPRLSPGKTWEGVVGGILASIAVAWVCLRYGFPWVCGYALEIPWWGPLVLGLFCAISGMIGDLAESYIKRDTGVKDSGGMLPGMGGVWDVTDSLIGAAVPAFLCFAVGVAGPIQ